MKVFTLTIIVLITNILSCGAIAKDKSKALKKDKVSIAVLNTDSYGTITDGTAKAGAWDWRNWEDVVSDCKLYVFRTSMVSQK